MKLNLNNNLVLKKKFFKDINYLNLENEIIRHQKKLSKLYKKKKLKLDGGGVLNFIDQSYTELNKILKQIFTYKPIYKYFGTKFIINSIASVILKPSQETYSRSSMWHRDTRFLSKSKKTDMILCVIPVTICNSLNGSTMFKINKKILIPNMHPGDFLMCDARVLHKAGENQTNNSRKIITISLTPPHIKPVMDYSEIAKRYNSKDIYARQLLGYYSRTPKSFSEFFTKSTRERFFLKDQMKI